MEDECDIQDQPQSGRLNASPLKNCIYNFSSYAHLISDDGTFLDQEITCIMPEVKSTKGKSKKKSKKQRKRKYRLVKNGAATTQIKKWKPNKVKVNKLVKRLAKMDFSFN